MGDKLAFQELKDWCIREREDNLKSIERYESGNFRMRVQQGGNDWVDISAQQEADCRRTVAEMDTLILKIEAEHGL